jgi:hypothetical protein
MARPKKDTETQQPVKPTVQKVEVTRAMPQVHEYVAPHAQDMAVLVNLKTGKRTPMSRQYAERRQRKNPSNYKVV